MSAWDRDYIDEAGPGRLVIRKNGMGELGFGLVQAEIDSRMDDIGGAEHLAFTFAGGDEMDETYGRGWAVVSGKNRLEGRLCFHLGEESTFSAEKERPEAMRRDAPGDSD